MPSTDPHSHDHRYLVTGVDQPARGYAFERERGSHDCLLIYTVDGAGLFTHATGRFTARPHDAVLLEPGAYHRYEVAPGCDAWGRLWAHFVPPPTWRPFMDWPRQGPGARKLRVQAADARKRVIDRLRHAHAVMSGYMRHREPLGLNAVEAALLWCDQHNPDAELARLDPRVREALDYLSRNLDRRITLQRLANHCNISASRLSHLFREQVGSSPHRFLERQRLARAKQLLELSGLSIAEVAFAVGFDDPLYFSQRFRKDAGQSPRDYRKTHRDGASPR